MRAAAFVLLLALASSAGCIENMKDLKAALGVVEPAPVPLAEPDWLPPLARAQANLSNVLVDVPVRFSSEGTRDPQGFALELAWTFGDGASARGPTVTHAFATPGEYTVRLTATNDVGLSDVASVTLQVRAPGRAPVACLAVTDASGDAPAVVRAGDELTFDASCSKDPENGALTYDWDLGGGVTSHEAKVSRAFETPGRHVVKLKVTDPTGMSAETTRTVAVDLTREESGTFGLTDTSREHPFPFAEGAARLELTLTFPGGLGGNDLVLVVKDAEGKEVKRTSDRTAPGAQDAQVRTLSLASADLSRLRAGTWTAEVTKAQGLTVDYKLTLVETF